MPHYTTRSPIRQQGDTVPRGRRRLDPVPNDPLKRVLEDRGTVGIESEDKARVDHDAAAVQHFDQAFIPGDVILTLVDDRQGIGVDAFKSDEETLAARLLHDVEEIGMVDDVGRHRRIPLEPERAHRLHERTGKLRIKS